MGTCRVILVALTVHILSIATAQEVVKRLPQGFVGMRGKKYIDDSLEQVFKRKPQFFVGVKGKKNFYDVLDAPEEYYKRAPMGFVGMRGKKTSLYPEYETNEYPRGSLIGQIDYTSNESKMDSEFPILKELLGKYLSQIDSNNNQATGNSNDVSEMTNEVDKRAANIHQFFGVRGKKSLDDKRPYDVSFRGKFIGVRGKKDLKNNQQAQEIKFFVDQNEPPLKRKGQMGFFGMRGKKWTDDSSPEMETPN